MHVSPCPTVPFSDSFHIMRNEALFGTSSLIAQFKVFMQSVVPTGTRNELKMPQLAAESGYDYTMQWGLGDEELTLRIEVKPRGASDIRPAPSSGPSSHLIPVLIAPYLSPTRRNKALEQSWSYWDATGNVLIRNATPLIYISREGARRDPGAPAERRDLESLKGQAASRVIEYLLSYPNRGAARDIARETGVGVGTVSRVVNLLRYENFVAPTGGPGTLIQDREALARRLVEDYSFVRSNRTRRYRSPLGRDGVIMALQRSGLRFATTGLAAARDVYAMWGRTMALPTSDLWLYADDVAAVEKAGMLEPDAREGDIFIADGRWLKTQSSYYPAATPRVYPWRVAFDLMSQPGRHASVGEDLLRTLIERDS